MNEYYGIYKTVRDCHNDHLIALSVLLTEVTKRKPEMPVKEFHSMKMEFMKRYFKENYEKYNIENL